MQSSNSNNIEIYTDGACDPNPGSGGWAALIIRDGKEQILKGGEAHTTNNRMELTAAIESLNKSQKSDRISIYTDSQYLKRGIEEWMENWIVRNWKRKGGKL